LSSSGSAGISKIIPNGIVPILEDPGKELRQDDVKSVSLRLSDLQPDRQLRKFPVLHGASARRLDGGMVTIDVVGRLRLSRVDVDPVTKFVSWETLSPQPSLDFPTAMIGLGTSRDSIIVASRSGRTYTVVRGKGGEVAVSDPVREHVWRLGADTVSLKDKIVLSETEAEGGRDDEAGQERKVQEEEEGEGGYCSCCGGKQSKSRFTSPESELEKFEGKRWGVVQHFATSLTTPQNSDVEIPLYVYLLNNGRVAVVVGANTSNLKQGGLRRNVLRKLHESGKYTELCMRLREGGNKTAEKMVEVPEEEMWGRICEGGGMWSS